MNPTHQPSKLTSRGFTMIEIMIVVFIIGVILAIAIPAWIQARTNSQAKVCQENLKQIEGAVTRWAFDNSKSSSDSGPSVDNLVNNGIYLRKEYFCPAGGGAAYILPATVASNPACPTNIVNHVLP